MNNDITNQEIVANQELYPEAGAEQSDFKISFDEKMDMSKGIVELLIYVSIIGRAFGEQLRILSVQGLSGGIILISGTICFFLMLFKREKLPVSFYFALAINIFANVSMVVAVGKMPIYGEGLRSLLFWMCILLMMCYVARNGNAAKRLALTLGLIIIAAHLIGGTGVKISRPGEDHERLVLEGVAIMFSDANDLAYMAGTVAVALLFFSVESRKVSKPFYWVIILMLLFILFRTVSRGALFFLILSVIIFCLTISLGKKGRLGFIILIILGFWGSSRVAYELSETKETYLVRLHRYSVRIDTWVGTVDDLGGTLIFGRGPAEAYTQATGIRPHNTFFWLHLAYGGICGWAYNIWIIVFCIRGWRLLRSPYVPLNTKLMVLSVFTMAMGCQLMNNFGPRNYGVILGMALVDKYTAPFSGRAYRRSYLEIDGWEQNVNLITS